MSTEHPEHLTDEDEAAKAKTHIGVPNIILKTVSPQLSMIAGVLREQILPSFNEVSCTSSGSQFLHYVYMVAP